MFGGYSTVKESVKVCAVLLAVACQNLDIQPTGFHGQQRIMCITKHYEHCAHLSCMESGKKKVIFQKLLLEK